MKDYDDRTRAATIADVPEWIDADITIGDLRHIIAQAETDAGFAEMQRRQPGQDAMSARVLRSHADAIVEYLDGERMMESLEDATEGNLRGDTRTIYAAVEQWARNFIRDHDAATPGDGRD